MFLAGLRLEIENTSAVCVVAAQPTKVSLLASVIQFGAGKVASAKTAWEELPAPVTPQLPRSGIGKPSREKRSAAKRLLGPQEKEKASRLFVADDCPTGSADGLTRPLQALTYNQFVDWCAPWPGQADA